MKERIASVVKGRLALGLLVAAMTAIAGGCATMNAPDLKGQEILVTFPVQRFSETAFGGSTKAYHAGGAWQATLHTRQLVRQFTQDYQLQQNDAWPIKPLGVYCVAFQAVAGSLLPEELLARISADPRVSMVQVNQHFEGMTVGAGEHYDDPLFDLQYGQFRRSLENLHRISTGRDVRIGVIDSNVDVDHPDLKGQVTRMVELMPDADLDDAVHGTAVTGVIGAAAGNGVGLVGLAPEASIFAFGACEKVERKTLCSSFALAKAISYAIEADVDILNMSLAGPNDELLAALLDEAVSGGMIVIAADNPGNAGRNFPANLPAVHSVHADSRLWFARSEQLSTQAGGGYRVFFGSSVASAGLAGLAALVRSATSRTTTTELLNWLLTEDCRAPNQASLTEIEVQWLCD